MNTEWVDDLDQRANLAAQSDSYKKEALFNQRLEFANYGEAAMMMALDLMNLSEQEFFDKYTTFKHVVLDKIQELKAAIASQDYVKRNELYDFFIEVL